MRYWLIVVLSGILLAGCGDERGSDGRNSPYIHPSVRIDYDFDFDSLAKECVRYMDMPYVKVLIAGNTAETPFVSEAFAFNPNDLLPEINEAAEKRADTVILISHGRAPVSVKGIPDAFNGATFSLFDTSDPPALVEKIVLDKSQVHYSGSSVNPIGSMSVYFDALKEMDHTSSKSYVLKVESDSEVEFEMVLILFSDGIDPECLQ